MAATASKKQGGNLLLKAGTIFVFYFGAMCVFEHVSVCDSLEMQLNLSPVPYCTLQMLATASARPG